MKKQIILLSLFILFCSCINDNVKNDLQKLKLKGNTKTLLVNYYQIEFVKGKIIKRSVSVDDADNPDADSKCNFNEKGFITSKITPYKDIAYSYDEKNRLVKIISDKDTIRYKYDAKGSIMTEKIYDVNGSYFLTKVKNFDLKNNLRKEISYPESDKSNLVVDKKYEYDEFNNVVKIDDKKVYKNQYDHKGNLIASNLFYKNEHNELEPVLSDTYRFKYDDQSNLIYASNYKDSTDAINNKEYFRKKSNTILIQM